MHAWKKRKIPSRKSKRKTLAPTQVKYLEGVSWTGELPPVGPQFKDWLDQNTHSLKLAAKYGDQESIDELIEILKYPCLQPHHPENAELTASVCETVASKIRSVAPSAATDDIADRLNYESQNLESNLATYWREHHKFNFDNDKEINTRLTEGTIPPGSTLVSEYIDIGYRYPGDSRNHPLPENLHVAGNLKLYNYPYQFLPLGLRVDGVLGLYDSNLVALPSGLKSGALLIDGSKRLKSLPSDLEVDGTLSVYMCDNLEIIPDTIKFGELTIPNGSYYTYEEFPLALHAFKQSREGNEVKPSRNPRS